MNNLIRLTVLILLLVGLILPHASTPVTYAAPSQLASANFAGASAPQYVEIPASSQLNLGSQTNYTLEAWVSTTNTTGCQTILGNGQSSSYWLGLCDGKLQFSRSGSLSSVTGTSTIAARRWNHIAVVYANGRHFFYVNGTVDIFTKGYHTPVASLNTPVGIGADIDNGTISHPFLGSIDNVRIWTTNRSLDQIRNSMYLTFAGPQTDLVAEWSFNRTWADAVGGHNGINHGAIFSSNDVSDIVTSVPQLPFTNNCTNITGATTVFVGTDTYIAHTSSDVYVCLAYTSTVWQTDTSVWATIYLDPNVSRDALAQTDDLALRVYGNGTMQAFNGDGIGNYTRLMRYWCATDHQNTSVE